MTLVQHSSPVSGTITPAAADVPRTFSNAAYDITLTKAYIKMATAEIHECPTRKFTWRNLQELFMPSAFAHGGATSTSATVEQVINLMKIDLQLHELGAIEPPEKTYCDAAIVLNAADATTHEMPLDVDMVGKTFHFEGTFSTLGSGAPGTTFIISSNGSIEKEIEFSPSLELKSANGAQKIVLGTVYDQWFTDVDFMASDVDKAAKVLSNLANSFEYYTGTYTE